MRRAFSDNYPITRKFGVFGSEYSNYPGSKHPGTDYLVPANRPLLANQSGTVTIFDRPASLKTGRGKEVVITKGNKQTKTCHMNKIDVVNGQQVKEGQAIGLSGHTGYVIDSQGNIGTPAGAHLHNELMINGQYVNIEDNLNQEDDMYNGQSAKFWHDELVEERKNLANATAIAEARKLNVGQVDKVLKMGLRREPTAEELGNLDYQTNPGLLVDTIWNNGGEQFYLMPAEFELVTEKLYKKKGE